MEIKWESAGERYIDYEAYGRDVRLEQGGILTEGGCYVALIDTPVEYTKRIYRSYTVVGCRMIQRVGDW